MRAVSDVVPPLFASHAAERAGLDRRRFLAIAAGSLGALFLAACDAQGPAKAHALLQLAERGTSTSSGCSSGTR